MQDASGRAVTNHCLCMCIVSLAWFQRKFGWSYEGGSCGGSRMCRIFPTDVGYCVRTVPEQGPIHVMPLPWSLSYVRNQVRPPKIVIIFRIEFGASFFFIACRYWSCLPTTSISLPLYHIRHGHHAPLLAARFCRLLLCRYRDVTLPQTLTDIMLSLMTWARRHLVSRLPGLLPVTVFIHFVVL